MQVEGGYIVYQAPLSSGAPARVAGSWQAEMLDWLGLYDGASVRFARVPPSVGEAAPPSEADRVMGERRGSVLASGTVLKPDHFPGMHSERVTGPGQPRIEGAPNYRALSAMDDGKRRPDACACEDGSVIRDARGNERTIHGTAQPTLEGIRGVLEQTGEPATWINLREEPAVYVNGRPFNVRRHDDPTENMQYPGSSTHEVERMEERLKGDILDEAARNGGRLLVHDEAADGRLEAHWEPVSEDTVLTTREAFDQIPGARLVRVPITDEKRPEDRDIDAIVGQMAEIDQDQPVIFNCHQGRGRTTTAMVAAGLIRRAQASSLEDSITKSPPVRQDIKEQGGHQPGQYRVILGLVRALESRDEEAMGDHPGLKSIRDSIHKYREESQTGATPRKREEALDRAKNYLDRYFTLVALDEYAREQAPAGFRQPFTEWRGQHPELERLHASTARSLGLH